ncbi:hypothetical protein [Profundibacter sp.]|uniref:hypothetical protein n=1 Tax=Profundibacter sp. TaxID=3101071 RepID=UPI003D0BF41C
MIRSNQAGQAKNRPPRREEGENGNLQRFPLIYSYRPPSSCCKYLGGAGVKPPLGPVGQTTGYQA